MLLKIPKKYYFYFHFFIFSDSSSTVKHLYFFFFIMCLFACVVYDGVIEGEPVEEFAKQYREPELEEPYCEPEMLLAPWRYMFS